MYQTRIDNKQNQNQINDKQHYDTHTIRNCVITSNYANECGQKRDIFSRLLLLIKVIVRTFRLNRNYLLFLIEKLFFKSQANSYDLRCVLVFILRRGVFSIQ